MMSARNADSRRRANAAIGQTYAQALDALVEEIKEDHSILAAILCGSLSHDTVWSKSDIDLMLVTIDDRLVAAGDITLSAGGISVHAMLVPRAKFRTTVEGALHQSFMHSLLAKGRLLYTHDPTIADLCARLGAIGDRDTEVQLLRAAIGAIGPIDKAHKWFVTRGDLEYSALWILHAASNLARIEVISARLVADREVIPQAAKLNPAFFRIVYSDLLNVRKTPKNVQTALDAIDRYIADRARLLFALVVDHLRDVGETRSCTELENHFQRNFDVSGVTAACEYLARQGLIGKASTAARLTKRSRVDVQEMAFYALTP